MKENLKPKQQDENKCDFCGHYPTTHRIVETPSKTDEIKTISQSTKQEIQNKNSST